MRQLIKADALTLSLAAVLGVAAVWLLFDQIAGARNPLANGLFFFALGLFLGNQIRVLTVTSRPKP